MRKLVTVGLVGVFLLALLVATATAAVPKPWQWTPRKAGVRLLAANPFVFLDSQLRSATCTGLGRSRAGRYSRFRCEIEWGPYGVLVLVRVLPIGSGRLCLPTAVAQQSGERVALPGRFPSVVPERACPTA